MVTQAGIDLIDTIDEELLKSAKLTGIWENKLRQIEDGSYSASEFIDELKSMIEQIVHNVLTDNSMKRIAVADEDAGKGKGGAKGKTGSADGEPKPARKRAPAIKSLEQIVCPLCGEGHILKGRMAYGCSRYASGCTLNLPFVEFPSDLTPARLAAAVKKKFKS